MSRAPNKRSGNTYVGTPCAICSGTERYCSTHGCVNCNRKKANARYRTLRALNKWPKRTKPRASQQQPSQAQWIDPIAYAWALCNPGVPFHEHSTLSLI